MKKKLALLLALSLTVSSLLTGCGGSEGWSSLLLRANTKMWT